MPWQETHQRLLAGLLTELRGQWGRIREVEESLGISTVGYLNKLCSGKRGIRLRFLLRTLDALDVDPASFFSRTLQICPRSEDYLRQLEDPDEDDRDLARIAQAARQIEAGEALAAEPGATAGAAAVDDFARKSVEAQLRSLRRGRLYRSHAFAFAYLKHLDAYRYDHGEEAARLATGVVVSLLPKLPGSRRERLALLCLGLGVFGSARRLKGHFSTASRALQRALAVARRAGLLKDEANLLIRASYVLADHGHYRRALALLNGALVLFVRLGSRQGMGRVLVEQGMMSCYLGEYRTAVQDLKQALVHLAESTHELPRYHLAAYQFLAYAYEQRRQLVAAEGWLAKGVQALGTGPAVDRARLEWSRGNLALRRGDAPGAERRLRSVLAVLRKHENTLKEALVSLDLLRALLAQSKVQEATETAVGMGQLLWKFKNNPLAEATVMGLVRAALAGQLDEELIRQVQTRLSEERAPALDRPGQPPAKLTSK